MYKHGRAPTFFKIKVSRECEAKISAVISQNSFLCELPGGRKLIAPASCEDPEVPFRVGDIVSIRYSGFSPSNDEHRLPLIHRHRPDTTWHEVIRSSSEQTKERTLEEIHGQKFERKGKRKHDRGFWNKLLHCRTFLDKFAEIHGYDSLNPHCWYNSTREDLWIYGGRGMLEHYQSFKKAILDGYPEIALQVYSFKYGTEKYGYWQAQDNTRQFFDSLSRAKGADPLNPDLWYATTYRKICEAGGQPIFKSNHGSYFRTIWNNYPEIGLNLRLFDYVSNSEVLQRKLLRMVGNRTLTKRSR